jgi:crotonobetainyl-CoA:carnitine CoA-transferase CaiB-like acyl-CoA transferase
MNKATGPLQGVTVLDLTRVLSGPYCTMMLGDMGARVIKIEHPDRGDDTRTWGPPFVAGESTYFLSVNRNKESVTLDFKRDGGRRVLEALLKKADVLVENFRPGTLARHALDYASVATRFPRLVYASVSGYGQTGPRATEPGYDAVLQGEGGLMSITGPTDGAPSRLGVAVADIVTGMFAANGIVLALYTRQTTNRGQQVDVGMLDSIAALLTYQAGIAFATGRSPERMGNRHPSIAPYDTYAAKDGTIVLAVGNDEQWQRFCRVAGLFEAAADARFTTNESRVRHCEALTAIVAGVMHQRTRAEWTTALVPAGVPCGPVRAVDEVLTDPQLAAREMVQRVEHATAGLIPLLGFPIKLSATPGAIRRAPPTLGQDTVAVLRELGFDGEEIDALRASGAI